jgi:hypothetical protein
MRVNIIHLPHRTDRWATLQRELGEQGIADYKIWEGIVHQDDSRIGISRAHKKIVKHAQDNNMPEVLIAEDDLRFTADGAFQFFIGNKPIDYDIYLAGIYHGDIKEDNTVEDFAALTFYIVNEKFYNTFLAMPDDRDLDRALCCTGKFVVCNPFAVIQYNGYSDNAKRYFNDDHYLKNRKLFGQEPKH